MTSLTCFVPRASTLKWSDQAIETMQSWCGKSKDLGAATPDLRGVDLRERCQSAECPMKPAA